MDLWTAFQALILGVVEGLTEFLPISSTGHQIIVADLLNFGGERAIAFNIIIQLGAILAVVWEFRRKILDVVTGLPTQPSARRFTANLLIAFMPAVVLGVIFSDLIHHYLFNPITVATALVVGGVIMLWAEKRQHQVHAETVDEITWQDALKVGFAQCLAMIPGTSRSGSTIIGGLLFGLSSPVRAGGFSGVRDRFRDGLHLRDDRGSRPAQVHRQPQLRGVCLVSDRVRPGHSGHLAVRLG
jgi:undecaprenyl-diphosphatase